MAEERSKVALFDVETTGPPTRTILEFGAILVCPETLVELCSYTTLIRPAYLSHNTSFTDRSNGITKDALLSAPTFADIADIVYDLLHGRIWAGHNILDFDCDRIREAYAKINMPPPEPKGTIDSLQLLRQEFGRRAGDMKLESLASYFKLGDQTHRSLDDCRMNLEVIKHCATVLFLESPNAITGSRTYDFSEPDGVSIPFISVALAPSYPGTQRIQILHQYFPLQLKCAILTVRYGFNTKFVDHAGRPRLNFVVDAPPNLCNILDEADRLAQKLSTYIGSSSKWHHVVTRKPDFFPTVRLNLPYSADEEIDRWTTEIYLKESSTSTMHELTFSRFDVTELNSLFNPGTVIDAYFSVDAYDVQQSAGIRLVAKKLIVHPS